MVGRWGMGKRSDSFWVLGVNGLDVFFLFLLLLVSLFFLIPFFSPPWGDGHTHFAGRVMIDWRLEASSWLDVQWMDGWMDGWIAYGGWFLLSWEDMMGGCWLLVLDGWLDGSGRCRFNNITKIRHLSIMRREGGVFLVCVISPWLLLLSGFLLAPFVSCALLGWMDGATLHNTTCMRREHSPLRV